MDSPCSDSGQFTENLRIWLSSNVLVPLVEDIDATNKALRAAAPEIQIGSVGVDKLKKTAQNISGLKQLADVSSNTMTLQNFTGAIYVFLQKI